MYFVDSKGDKVSEPGRGRIGGSEISPHRRMT